MEKQTLMTKDFRIGNPLLSHQDMQETAIECTVSVLEVAKSWQHREGKNVEQQELSCILDDAPCKSCAGILLAPRGIGHVAIMTHSSHVLRIPT